jgi:GAF domain-containing protein/HAMP domain-containing protein
MTNSNLLNTEKESRAQASTLELSDSYRKLLVNATWAAVLLLTTSIAFFIYAVTSVNFHDWQDYVLVGFPVILAVTSLTGIYLMRRDRLALGSGIIFVLNLLVPVLLSAFLTESFWPAFLFGSVSSTLLIWRALPRRSWRWSIIATAVVLLFVTIIGVVNPSGRLNPTPTMNAFFAVVITLLVAAFVAQAVRQAWQGKIRIKLMTGITLLVIVSVGVLALINYYNNQRTLTTSAGTALKSIVDSQATAIGNTLYQEVHSLQSFSLSKVVQDKAEQVNASYGGDQAANLEQIQFLDKQWRAADTANNDNDPLVSPVLNNEVSSELREYRDTFPENVEVFVTDKYGANIAATNRTSDYYQADEEWWQVAYNNGQGAVYIGQPEFDQSSNTFGLNIAIPLYAHGTQEVTGVLRTTVNINSVMDILSVPLLGGTAHADLYLPGDQALAPEENVQGLRPSDPEALKRIPALTSGTPYDTFNLDGVLSVVSAAPVSSTDPAFQPVLQNLGWVLIVDQTEADYLAPVRAQTGSTTAVALVIILLSAGVAVLMAQLLSAPIVRLTSVAEQIAAGNTEAQARVESKDEIGKLASVFNSMTGQLRELIGSLEQRVASRTRNLELAAEVARSVTQVRNLDEMLRDACELILKEFNLYYVQVYLTDPSGSNLKLEAGTGTVGAELLGRSHSLPLNTGSINGRAAVEKHSIVISDTAESPAFRPNKLLPDTRGEMAVPLIVADKVVGVLDMQSSEPGVLNTQILPAFEALAGQMAVAVQNANLLAETEQARAQVESQARRLVRKGWSEHLDAIHKPEQLGFVFDHNQVAPLADMDEKQMPDDGKSVSAPIALTGEALGSLVVELDDEARAEQTSELVSIVARQVAQQIETLRLLESAERYRAESERAVRLQTIEGWQSYISSRPEASLGYLYDTKEVRPKDGKDEDPSMFALPIKAREEMIGKLSVAGLTHEDQESVELVNAVAERLSAHIENLRLFEETRQGQIELDKRARQLAAVAEVSNASSRELDIQKMLETVVHLTQRQFNLYHAHVFIFNEANEELQIAACGWKEGDEHEGTHGTTTISLNREQSLVARAARTKKAVIVNNVFTEPGWLPNPLLPDTASELAVPLVIGDRVLGVLDVQSDRVNAFTEEDANIQTTLASQVATALQNAQSFTKAQKQAERETMLNVINQKIQSATSVEAVLQIAARELGHALGAPMTVAQLSMKDRTS